MASHKQSRQLTLVLTELEERAAKHIVYIHEDTLRLAIALRAKDKGRVKELTTAIKCSVLVLNAIYGSLTEVSEA